MGKPRETVGRKARGCRAAYAALAAVGSEGEDTENLKDIVDSGFDGVFGEAKEAVEDNISDSVEDQQKSYQMCFFWSTVKIGTGWSPGPRGPLS